MKSLFLGVVLICFGNMYAQNISDFKYVLIPDELTDFEENQYRMKTHLQRFLESKKYVVLNSNPTEWPEEVRQNPCLIVTADIRKVRKVLKNKVAVEFIDCTKKQILVLEGESNIKELNTGYPDALKKSLQLLRASNPKDLSYENTPTIMTTQEIQAVKVQGNISENSWLESGIEFRNGTQTVILSGLKDGSYILIRKENSEVMAQLKPSSRKGIFHTTVISPDGNYATIGFYDEKTIGIEFKNNSNEFILTEFKKTN